MSMAAHDVTKALEIEHYKNGFPTNEDALQTALECVEKRLQSHELDPGILLQTAVHNRKPRFAEVALKCLSNGHAGSNPAETSGTLRECLRTALLYLSKNQNDVDCDLVVLLLEHGADALAMLNNAASQEQKNLSIALDAVLVNQIALRNAQQQKFGGHFANVFPITWSAMAAYARLREVTARRQRHAPPQSP